jgi:hypothetical protein
MASPDVLHQLRGLRGDVQVRLWSQFPRDDSALYARSYAEVHGRVDALDRRLAGGWFWSRNQNHFHIHVDDAHARDLDAGGHYRHNVLIRID